LEVLKKIDGVLFTGGIELLFDSFGETQYHKTIKNIINYSKHQLKYKNEVFPVFGTCLGFQSML